MYRAYCTCLRNEDRYAFVTIDTIRDLLRERTTASLKEQSLELSTANRELHLKNAELSAQRAELSDRLKLAQEQLDKTDASEYEMLLSEALEETDRLNKGLDALIARLYANPGEGLPADEMESSAKLGDLYQALNYCFDRFRRWE
jgi:seryl-tRNA synthetase